MKMIRNLRKVRQDTSGASAIEFGLTVPVLLICLLGVVDLGNVVYQRGDLEAALRSGIQYFMSGGTDLDEAKAIVDAAWTHRPEGAVLTAEKFCLCGTTVSVCTQLCGDGTYPVSYQRLTVNVTFEGILTEDTYVASQAVRVR
jgi:Flp pilus assembly protein TadG